ncbi:CRISPR-associated protein Cas4 [Halioxenophilus sp. WMMB6]|uniref:CRISPR-associated protein Cas4 n=1 Tax=Halioxenophilus sp. WMMB6 TaxID=3073815 RepID=UPI00295EB336|nr:CRISPR-associated protein Cas4 [Halioxenophilus sp. WMMB6]
MDDNPQPLFISALQHIAYCPRQFALIHVEQAWEENRFTAEGKILHERVDSGLAEQRRGTRYERGVMLRSEQYQIQGKMDLLEIEIANPPIYYPVEYKRGKPKVEDWDRIQLCAQVLCLEEMRNCTITEGALWYWETRRREEVAITTELRATTVEYIRMAHDILHSGKTPGPTTNLQRCRACSLVDLCEPKAFRKDHSSLYIDEMFKP